MIPQHAAVIRLINKAKLNDRLVGLFKLQKRFQFLHTLFGFYLIVVKRVRGFEPVGFGEALVAVTNDIAFKSAKIILKRAVGQTAETLTYTVG